ncbi:type II toxin-antitoxin system ParD family antitoxin [Serratia sp. S1B]|nr:type II toxin-antitoxin system ParD family antitoxin [Serratia sp. S1B]
MVKTISVTLGEQFDAFIDQLIDSGRYNSANEVMCSALRLLEQQNANDEIASPAVIAGLASGESPLSLREIGTQRKLKQGV